MKLFILQNVLVIMSTNTAQNTVSFYNYSRFISGKIASFPVKRVFCCFVGDYEYEYQTKYGIILQIICDSVPEY